MNRLVLCGFVVVAVASTAGAGVIDPELQDILAARAPDESVSALIYLHDKVNIDALSRQLTAQRANAQQRHETVVRALQAKAKATQAPLLAELEEMQRVGLVRSYEAFWIANIIRVDAPAAQIEFLAAHPSVDKVYVNHPVSLDEPTRMQPATDDPLRTPEPGLVAINVPQVWAMGIDGTGVLVANMDTGVAGNHPALASRWAGLLPQYAGHPEWAWHDALANPPSTFPSDGYGHGTHTMGTVCGGPPGLEIGVAPGARWIADNCINQGVGPAFHADVIAGFQWFADPDGNPATSWDVPAVCSNSWGVTSSMGYPPCDQDFWAYLDACEAAGCAIIFSAGNEGPGANTLRRPSDRATDAYRTMAVAAVNANVSGWPIASFSSRGPTYCTPDGSAAIKPDIAAPGVYVRSAVPPNGYQYMDGTSMASPHINGVMALMKQMCEDLTVEQMKQIIYDTAHDLGPAGEDNSYGWGMVDAYAAVLAAEEACGPHPPKVEDLVAATTTNTPVTIELLSDDDGEPVPPGVVNTIVLSLPANGYLVDPNGGVILSVPATLAANGNQVLYYPAAYFSGSDGFTFKANDGGTPPEGGDSPVANVTITVTGVSEIVYSYPLDENPGWSTQGNWAFGTPLGGGSHAADPTGGHTGSKVYGFNLSGDYANNMPAYSLTTTAIDCTYVSDVTLKFWRWLGVEQFDQASIQVSTDGTTWTLVWHNSTDVNDSAWSQQSVPVAALNNAPTAYIRWVMGPTDHSVTYPGWNIDDIEIWGQLAPPFAAGDVNCDGSVDFGDINDFVLRLSNFAAYLAAHPDCPESTADVNGDGVVNFGDINAFVALLAG